MRSGARALLVALAALALVGAVEPSYASANPLCKVASAGSGIAGKACDLLSSPGKVLSAGKNLLTGHLGKAFNSVFGGGGGSSAASTATTALGITAIVAWAVGGAKLALDETAKVLSETTRPQLGTTWFSSAYWRMAGIGALLTLPFLFAAAIQALMRADLPLLGRAALGYLPLAMLAISIAAPLTMLLLAATDQLCGLVAPAGEAGGVGILRASGVAAFLAGAAGAPFITFLIAVVTTGAALVLWIELAIREAAVYVIVLMLPLAFAALVWPARRIWAIRAVELLVALILSKFAIVAVLGLGGAALGHDHGLTAALAGTVLVLLGAFAPWAVLRLLPLSELAATAAGSMAPQLTGALPGIEEVERMQDRWPQAITAAMRRHRDAAPETNGRGSDREPVVSQQRTERFGTDSADPVAHAAPDGDAPLASDGEPDVLAPKGAAPPPPAEPHASDNPRADERLPGLGSMWQWEDLSWEPITLGPEAYENGDWGGPKLDIWPQSQAGEDHDPLPPQEEHDL